MLDIGIKGGEWMKNILGYGALLIMLCTVSICGCMGGGEDDLTKEGALEFGLKVVKTFFNNDMEKFISYLDDELVTLEGEGPISKQEARNFLEENGYVADEEFTLHTFDEYMETYDPKVMDADEVNAEWPELAGDMKALGWDFDGNDYIFIGYETKSGDEGFLWDDPLVFGITSEGGHWSFKAFSG